MSDPVDFRIATSREIEAALCERLEQIRLARNVTQRQLAEEAGVSLRTIGRMEKGEGISLGTFIRVLRALRIQTHLESLLPDPTVRPIERAGPRHKQRRRARPKPGSPTQKPWTWGNDDER